MRPLISLLVFASVAVLTTLAGEPLFNGQDFTGWKTKASKAAPEGVSLDRQSEAYKGRFKVLDGSIVIDGVVKGDAWIETAREIEGDVTIRVEFLPGPTCNNDTLFRGIKFDLKKPDIKNLKDNEWNTLEIVVRGNQVEYKCNGETIKTFTTKSSKSPFALRAEAGTIKVRKVEVEK